MRATVERPHLKKICQRAGFGVGFLMILGFAAGCSPPVVEDVHFQNVPISTKMSGQITNASASHSVSPTFQLVNGVSSLNNGQNSSASTSFRLTGGITYSPPQ